MAMPSLSHEDLQKLKDFIDFVTANPTILNFPQLDFVKKFIEKFGGKVPPGDFQMPGEGKCPFGGGGGAGGVKTEGNAAEPEEDSEPEEAEMESDSESEIELDMEVDNIQKPQGAKQPVLNAVFIKEMEDVDVKKKKKDLKEIKKDIISEDEEYDMTDYGSGEEDGEDPINTTLSYCIKTEVKEIGEDDNDYQEENSDESEENIKSTKKSKSRRYQTRQSSKKSDKDFWRSLKKREKVKKPKLFNCTKNCKQNCKSKIDKQWRQDLCAEFWNLNVAERQNYILKYVESRPVLRLRIIRKNRSTRGRTNRYFLKNRCDEKVRVCLAFFLSTLSISGQFVKIAMENSDAKVGLIEQENSSGHKEKADYPQKETINNDNKKEGVSNAEKKSDIEIQISSEEGIITNIELETEVNTPEVITKELKVAQKPIPQKSTSSSTKRNRKKEHLPKPVKCNEGCQMKCTSHYSEEQRQQICATFWSMDYKRRKDFLLSRVKTQDVATMTTKEYRKTERAKRSFSNRFYFKGGRGENIRVCLSFFKSTLSIGQHTIYTAIKNADPNTGSYIGEDMRSTRPPANKIPQEMLNEVKRHIESYPTWVPNKKYKTRFLHSSLNILKMYREYKQICIDQQRKFVNTAYFRNVFHKEYRLAFLKPKTKHPQKISPKKKDKNGDTLTFKKLNPNISEFTGEEGGFWMPAGASIAAVEQMGNQYSQIDGAPYEVNCINIQQNLQLQAPLCVQQTPFLNVLNATQCSASTSYLQQQSEKSESLENDSHNVMASFANPTYAQDSSVFRIL